MWATITGRLFINMQKHARPIVVLSSINKFLTYMYMLTSDQIYRGLSPTVNGSIHIYSIYHRIMHAQSPTELYYRLFVGFLLTKREISNDLRPIAGVFLSVFLESAEVEGMCWWRG